MNNDISHLNLVIIWLFLLMQVYALFIRLHFETQHNVQCNGGLVCSCSVGFQTPCMETETTFSILWTKQFWGYSIDFVSQVNHLKVWSAVIHWEVWDVDDDVKVRAGVYVPDGWWSLPWSSWLLLLRFIYFYFVFMTANNYTGVCHMVIAGVDHILLTSQLYWGDYPSFWQQHT